MGVVSKNDTVECITRAKAFWNMLYPAARLETLSDGVTVSAMPRIRKTGQHSRQGVTDAEREERSANTKGSVCTHVVGLVKSLDAFSSPIPEEQIVRDYG